MPAREGRFGDAAALVETYDADTASDLLLLADIAFSRKDAATSERLLTKIATISATPEEHAIAEFKRGQRTTDPKRAAECFERAIAHGLPPSLHDAAVLRLNEARRAK